MFINKRINSKKSRDSRGFTLIEVLIAMAIFSIGILAVGSMQLSATRGSSSARLSTEAVILAQSQAETLILLPYNSSPALDTGSHGPNTVGVYRVRWEVWDTATGPTPWGVTPAVNTKIIQVVATSLKGGVRRRSATITFAKGQDV
jgi:prepilin-type N-terminal cleavage/methylation domain-containing protein